MPAKRGFLEKSVVSSLVLATIMGTATPAFAASIQDNVNLESSKITAEYGVSVESAIQNIRNTIDAIN